MKGITHEVNAQLSVLVLFLAHPAHSIGIGAMVLTESFTASVSIAHMCSRFRTVVAFLFESWHGGKSSFVDCPKFELIDAHFKIDSNVTVFSGLLLQSKRRYFHLIRIPLARMPVSRMEVACILLVIQGVLVFHGQSKVFIHVFFVELTECVCC